jgi:RNA-dependent RNA polymerase
MSAFLAIQDRAVRKVEKAQTSFLQAAKLFRLNSLGTSFRATNLFTLLSEMLNVDFDSSPKEHIDFFRSSTMLSITHCLRDIKYRARIAVAGPTLIGVCDTWGLLKPGEIYVKVVEDKRKHPALRGKVVITRR